VAVEPPFIEGHMHEGRNRTIVIGKHFASDIEAEHAGMPDTLMRIDTGSAK
jgi:hypothetical protein